MTDIETKISSKQIAEDFLKKDLTNVNNEIDTLFVELNKNLNNRLISLVSTTEGKNKMTKNITDLQKEIENIKQADKEMTQIFIDYITNRSKLGIEQELSNIYNELFFMQVKLINNTIYKVIQDKDTPKTINLKPLMSALHKKIESLNNYIEAKP
jgi:hypothetical protein